MYAYRATKPQPFICILDRGEETTSSLIIITNAAANGNGQYQYDPSASYPQHVNAQS